MPIAKLLRGPIGMDMSPQLAGERGKKETLWLGVEPRLPAIRQMCSIMLTSKCTNRYTTKDW
jgi:hypothetical protein